MKTRTDANINKLGAALLMAVLMSAATAFTLPSVAQAFPGRQGCDGPRLERMAERLNLSDAQRTQFKQLHRDGRAEGMALHDAMEDNRDALSKLEPGQKGYHQAVEKLAAEKGDLVRLMTIHRAEMKAKMNAVLTPEQRREAREYKQDRGERGFGRGGKDRPGSRDGGPGRGWM